jgi:hypothetical protein
MSCLPGPTESCGATSERLGTEDWHQVQIQLQALLDDLAYWEGAGRFAPGPGREAPSPGRSDSPIGLEASVSWKTR